jgi:preprotein translocase subunit SecB
MATYTLKRIGLLEANIKRHIPLTEEVSDVSKTQNHIDIKRSTERVSDECFVVHLDVKVSSQYSPEYMISTAFVKMSAVFEVQDASEPIEGFDRINAPAILFPYIREFISNLSTRAALPTLLLPPVNFVELAKQEEAGRN